MGSNMTSLENFVKILFIVNVVFTSRETSHPPTYKYSVSYEPTRSLDDNTVRMKE